MKGFKKDGKFRPTENRNKSSLKKSDIEHLNLLKKGRIEGVHDPQREDMIKSLEKRKDEGIDVQIPDVPVSSHFKVIDDGSKDHKNLEPIRLDAKPFEDYNIERQVLKALNELKKRNIISEDTQATFDDLGWEGGQLDVYMMNDDNYVSDLTDFKGIRLSLQAWVEHEGDNQDTVEELISDKLIDQFDDDGLAGTTIG